MLPKFAIPDPIPPKHIPGYNLPETRDKLLTWEFVAAQMSRSRIYWLATSSPQGQPHVAPVWGLWYENRVHFDGSPQTGWAQHLIKNPKIAVHLPEGDQVVVIEGQARMIGDDEIDSAEWERLDSAYRAKYNVKEGSPYWMVQPQKVLAWDGEALGNMTRWIFA